MTVAVAVFAFSTFTLAQDEKAATTDKEKAEKHYKGHGQDGHKGHGKRHHGGMMRMFHDLNLSDEQKTQIKSIIDANKPDQSVRDEMRTLFEAKRNGTLTAEQQTRIDALKEQAKANKQAIHQQIEVVLTAEQKAQLKQKKAEMKQLRDERRQQREKREKTPAATTETSPSN